MQHDRKYNMFPSLTHNIVHHLFKPDTHTHAPSAYMYTLQFFSFHLSLLLFIIIAVVAAVVFKLAKQFTYYFYNYYQLNNNHVERNWNDEKLCMIWNLDICKRKKIVFHQKFVWMNEIINLWVKIVIQLS